MLPAAIGHWIPAAWLWIVPLLVLSQRQRRALQGGSCRRCGKWQLWRYLEDLCTGPWSRPSLPEEATPEASGLALVERTGQNSPENAIGKCFGARRCTQAVRAGPLQTRRGFGPPSRAAESVPYRKRSSTPPSPFHLLPLLLPLGQRQARVSPPPPADPAAGF